MSIECLRRGRVTDFYDISNIGEAQKSHTRGSCFQANEERNRGAGDHFVRRVHVTPIRLEATSTCLAA